MTDLPKQPPNRPLDDWGSPIQIPQDPVVWTPTCPTGARELDFVES